MTQNHYNKDAHLLEQVRSNYVPATIDAPRQERRQYLARQTAEIAAIPTTITVDAPMTALEGTMERTTSMERSKALVVRLAPFSVVWLALAVGVAWGASMGGWFVLCLFAGLTACTYAVMDRQEHQFSRNGLERHKVNTLASLKQAEMAHQQELRRMALEAHLRMLGADHDNNA